MTASPDGSNNDGGYVSQNTPQISASELPTGNAEPISTMEVITTNTPQTNVPQTNIPQTNAPQTSEPTMGTELPKETEQTHSSEKPVQTAVVTLKPTVTPATSTNQKETANPVVTNAPSTSSKEMVGPDNPNVSSMPVKAGETEDSNGKIYIKSGVKYKVIKAKDGTKIAQVVGVKNSKKSLVTVPSTVKIIKKADN